MPHYKDGTPAKVGDLVMHVEAHEIGQEKILIVQSITPGSDTCNANAIPLAIRQKGSQHWFPWFNQLQWSVTLKECQKLMPMAMPEMAAKDMKEPVGVGT